MRIEPAQCEIFTIFDAPNVVDPITVVLQDFGRGRGRLIVECYGTAWSGYWGAMGDDWTIRRFLASCGADYITNKMIPGDRGRILKRDRVYLERIVETILVAIKAEGAEG